MVAPLIIAAGIAAGASLAGGALSAKSSSDQSEANTAYQREFAKHGVRWKVADAKAAGIHPLAALGSNTVSYAPNPVVPQDYGLKSAGQDISRAVSATKTQTERVQTNLTLDAQLAQTKLVKAQTHSIDLANIKTAREMVNQPPMPEMNPSGIIPHQTGKNNMGAETLTPGLKQIPSEQISSGKLGVEKGAQPMQKMTISEAGRIYFPLGKSAEESLENDPMVKYKFLGNRVLDEFKMVGSGILDKMIPQKNYNEAIRLKRNYIARELGIKPKYINYNRYKNIYSVNKQGRALLNRR